MPQKKKKDKEPFWKKYGPEVQSITKHIGAMAENMKFNDWADLMIITGLAYLGYDLTKNWKGALVGPIGYKLATTMGGTPPVSQIAGLTVLGTLGALALFPSPPISPTVIVTIAGYEFPIREIQIEKKPYAMP